MRYQLDRGRVRPQGGEIYEVPGTTWTANHLVNVE